MKRGIRIRRLTMAPKSSVDGVEEAEDDGLLQEARRLLDQDRLGKVTDFAITATVSPRPVVHGIEALNGSRFWALSSDEPSSDEDARKETSLETPLGVQSAPPKEVSSEAWAVGVRKPVTIVSEPRLVNQSRTEAYHRLKLRPWQGKLPSPRRSPVMTFGAAIQKAKVSSSAKVYSGRRGVAGNLSSTLACRASVPELVSGSRSSSTEFFLASIPLISQPDFPLLPNFKSGAIQGNKGPVVLNLRKYIPFRPTPGLVVFFSKTGTHTSSQRATHTIHTRLRRSTSWSPAMSTLGVVG